MYSIGYRIRCARERADITQDQLGKLCGTTKQTIFKYENGIVTNIPMDKIVAIAKALDVNPCYIMGWSEYSDPDDCRDASDITSADRKMLKKFHALDQRGKDAVMNVLNHEYESLPGEKAGSFAKEA